MPPQHREGIYATHGHPWVGRRIVEWPRCDSTWRRRFLLAVDKCVSRVRMLMRQYLNKPAYQCRFAAVAIMQLPQTDDRICSDPCAGPCAGCPDRIVCRCLKATEAAIVEAIITLGVRTLEQLRAATEAGTGCCCCHRELRGLLEVHSSSSSPMDICSVR
jgi:bacterioferritin-associated ferredoxin